MGVSVNGSTSQRLVYSTKSIKQWMMTGVAPGKPHMLRFTAEDNAPYRCFQANYMLILLREAGFFTGGVVPTDMSVAIC